MVSAYYFLIFLVDTLLSVFGKSATMLLPALLSAIASCLYASSDCWGKGWETFSRAITICIGFIIAGCGIHNAGSEASEHSGIHAFYLDENAKVKYVEKHYGSGEGTGENIMNPTTLAHLKAGAYLEMETTQIKGVDSTDRVTKAVLEGDSKIVVHEKIMTHGKQFARTEFEVELNGENSGAHVISRSVAKDDSKQQFISRIKGNNKCSGHTECDAIIMDNANVSAIPEILATDPDASLIHEAAIGKIAGEQLIKLMTLGLTEKEAEEEIVNGFLR